ncbi:MAG: hypothetical protein J3Q66DRAFT_168104 [Benniella sp.]|nr:MAG: hypothetical protein J3Q66DRAFT_168104 [Benniella sp.]
MSLFNKFLDKTIRKKPALHGMETDPISGEDSKQKKHALEACFAFHLLAFFPCFVTSTRECLIDALFSFFFLFFFSLNRFSAVGCFWGGLSSATHSLRSTQPSQCFLDQRERQRMPCIMQCLGRYWSGILHNNQGRENLFTDWFTWMGMNGQGRGGESAQKVCIGVAHAQPSWTDVNLFVCFCPFAFFFALRVCLSDNIIGFHTSRVGGRDVPSGQIRFGLSV